MSEARHCTIPECDEKLAELKTKYEAAQKAVEERVTRERLKLCKERQQQLTELATSYGEATKTWQNMRDCLKLEGD